MTIIEYIARNPGSGAAAIQAATGLTKHQVESRLRVLRDHGAVEMTGTRWSATYSATALGTAKLPELIEAMS